MKKHRFFPWVFFATALATIGFLVIFPVRIIPAQDETGPCPTPYVKTIYFKAGTPGDQIKIRGRRFGEEKGEVLFSPHVKAEVVKWTNSQIWVIVPQAAYTGPVTISKPCGTVSNGSYFKVIK
jgi:hypothetical protein